MNLTYSAEGSTTTLFIWPVFAEVPERRVLILITAFKSLVTLRMGWASVQMAQAQHVQGVGLRDVPQPPGHAAQSAGSQPGLAQPGRPAAVTRLDNAGSSEWQNEGFFNCSPDRGF